MIREARIFGKRISLIVGTESGLSELGIEDAETLAVSEGVFGWLSDEVTPQGVLAVIEREFYEAEKPEKSCVLLDGIKDPGNIGTIIRTCAAAGITDVYLADCCDPFSPKAVRSSMSGIFRVRLFGTEREKIGDIFKDIPLIAADMSGKDVFSFAPPDKFCLAIGSEAHGISEEVGKAAAYSVSVPMENGIESLNAGISLAVILYQFIKGAK